MEDLGGNPLFKGSFGPVIFGGDGAGDVTQLEKGLISPRRWANGRGYDIDELNDEIVADNLSRITKAQEAASKFNEANPEYPITWRDILKPYEGEAVFVGKVNPLTEPLAPQPQAPQTTTQEGQEQNDE